MEDTASPDAEQTSQMLSIARSVVGKLRETQWWRMQPTQMLDLGQEMQKLGNELYAAQVNLAGELDSQKIGEKFGCTSTAALLRQAFNISPAEANSRVNAARTVVPRDSGSEGPLPPILPALAAAMAAGDVNSEHAKLIVTTMSKLPAKLPVEDRDFWEQFLVQKAFILDPSPFERVCRSILDKADPDGNLDESTAAAKMEFSFGNRNLRTGLTPVKGQLDDYSVEVIKNAIDALAAPRPCSNAGLSRDSASSSDIASGASRFEDGTNAADGAGTADSDSPPVAAFHHATTATDTTASATAATDTTAGDTTASATTASATTASATTASATTAGATTASATTASATTASATTASATTASATTASATTAGTSRSIDCAGGHGDGGREDGRDKRSPANRRAHALVAALRGFLDAGLGPTRGGERPHITMVMNWDVVKGVVNEAGYASGGAISPAQARKFLCDAQIIPAIMGSASEVLDIGRKSRTFPVGMRRAIALRDGGCIWPGCDMPSGWCDCHHVNFWHRDHGDTCYQFGVLLCPHHHSEIHKDEWSIRMAADGIPELVPPKWMDPEQNPRRNNMHRPLEAR